MTDVIVKGEREGVVITVGATGDFDTVASAIVAHLERGGAFFRGATVTLDIGPRLMDSAQLVQMRDILTEQGVTLVALRASDEETRTAARQLGLDLPFTAEQAAPSTVQTEVPEGSHPALVIPRTLRNGQAVRHPDSVVVLGDVNPGAEVVAGGDVIVFGAVRGVVHAGASGDEGRIVCALELVPTQLRIGGQVARAPEERGRRRWFGLRRTAPRPEIARVQDGAITVAPWQR